VIVISDTTAITLLLKIRQEKLLHLLFQRLVIPTTVYVELSSYHASLPAWLVVARALDHKLLDTLKQRLDIREAEAITLAKESRAELLIIDEKKGRIIAEELGLNCIKLAGKLLLAKQRGLIDSLRNILERLVLDEQLWPEG
jgi:predicted nucleic acid-binding protein